MNACYIMVKYSSRGMYTSWNTVTQIHKTSRLSAQEVDTAVSNSIAKVSVMFC